MKILLWSDTHLGLDHNTNKIVEKFIFKKLSNEDFDLICLAGDLSITDSYQIRTLFGLLRKYIPNKPIFWVRGNHCFWQQKKRLGGYDEIHKYHQEISNEFDVDLVEAEGYYFGDYYISAFDGWYGYEPQTNDKNFISDDLFNFLRSKAHKDLNKVLDKVEKCEAKVKVCMTHFPPYTFQPQYKHMIANENYLTFIAEKFDYFLVGHSHRDEDWHFKDCRIINCGSDYNKPQAKIIDLEKDEVKTIKW